MIRKNRSQKLTDDLLALYGEEQCDKMKWMEELVVQNYQLNRQIKQLTKSNEKLREQLDEQYREIDSEKKKTIACEEERSVLLENTVILEKRNTQLESALQSSTQKESELNWKIRLFEENTRRQEIEWQSMIAEKEAMLKDAQAMLQRVNKEVKQIAQEGQKQVSYFVEYII